MKSIFKHNILKENLENTENTENTESSSTKKEFKKSTDGLIPLLRSCEKTIDENGNDAYKCSCYTCNKEATSIETCTTQNISSCYNIIFKDIFQNLDLPIIPEPENTENKENNNNKEKQENSDTLKDKGCNKIIIRGNVKYQVVRKPEEQNYSCIRTEKINNTDSVESFKCSENNINFCDDNSNTFYKRNMEFCDNDETKCNTAFADMNKFELKNSSNDIIPLRDTVAEEDSMDGGLGIAKWVIISGVGFFVALIIFCVGSWVIHKFRLHMESKKSKVGDSSANANANTDTEKTTKNDNGKNIVYAFVISLIYILTIVGLIYFAINLSDNIKTMFDKNAGNDNLQNQALEQSRRNEAILNAQVDFDIAYYKDKYLQNMTITNKDGKQFIDLNGTVTADDFVIDTK